VTSPLTSVVVESVLYLLPSTSSQSSDEAEMEVERKSGPVRSIVAPQNAKLTPSLAVHPTRPSMMAEPTRESQFECWYA
jgi:hypothetical protein